MAGLRAVPVEAEQGGVGEREEEAGSRGERGSSERGRGERLPPGGALRERGEAVASCVHAGLVP